MTLHFPLSASVPVRIFNILIAYCVQISISAFLFADETIMSLVIFTFLFQIIQIKTDTIFDLWSIHSKQATNELTVDKY